MVSKNKFQRPLNRSPNIIKDFQYLEMKILKHSYFDCKIRKKSFNTKTPVQLYVGIEQIPG